MDSQLSWLMTALLAYVGTYRTIIATILLMFAFGIPVFFFEMYLGTFTGTGIAWSARNAVPITAGIGAATMVQTFLLCTEEVSVLSALVIGSITDEPNNDQCQADYIFNKTICTTAINITDFCEFQNPLCKDGFVHGNSMQWFGWKSLTFQGFSWRFFAGQTAVLIIAGALSSLSVRHVVRIGKFVIIPAVILIYITLFVGGLRVRMQSKRGALLSYSHIGEYFSDITAKESFILCAKYFFDFLLIGQGVITASSRRSQLCKIFYLSFSRWKRSTYSHLGDL